jgi:hypothetical protein
MWIVEFILDSVHLHMRRSSTVHYESKVGFQDGHNANIKMLKQATQAEIWGELMSNYSACFNA